MCDSALDDILLECGCVLVLRPADSEIEFYGCDEHSDDEGWETMRLIIDQAIIAAGWRSARYLRKEKEEDA